MTVFIQDLRSKLFLNAASGWEAKGEAYDFRTPGSAIDLCMMRGLREVRVIVNWGDPEQSIFLEVHGTNAASLRTAMHENLELRTRQEELRRELDVARAEGKEQKRKYPFRRKRVADEQGNG